MRKKRFMAFLLSLAMAGTSVYTCGVIDVQAAAVENQEIDPNAMEQLADEIRAQSAAPSDVTEEQQPEAPVVDQKVDEPQAQAALELSGVTNGEAEWGSEVTITGSPADACFKIGQQVLSQGATYTISAGDVGKTITASANGRGVNFKAEKKTISVNYITGLATEVYNGSPITPKYTVSDSALIPEAEYVAQWENNTNAGTDTATLTITMKDSSKLYRGSATKPFSIDAKTLSIVTVRPESPAYGFIGKGTKVEPPVVDVLDGQTKLAASDYEISWTNNENTYDKPTASVTLKGNYKTADGSALTYSNVFRIDPNGSGKFDAKFNGRENGNFNQGTTFADVKAQLVVSHGNYNVSGGDYTMTCEPAIANEATALELGKTYKLKFTGKGNYTSAVTGTCEFKIAAQGISDGDIFVTFPEESSWTYDGEEQKPAVKVSVNQMAVNGEKTPVSLNSGYKVEYSDNINAGTAKAIVTVDAKQYTETPVTKTVSFNINPADMSSYAKSVKKNPIYNGGPQAPVAEDIVISANFNVAGKKYVLKPGVDYTVSQASYAIGHTEASDTPYTCAVSGNGNFKGALLDVSYKIEKVNISTNKAVSWTIEKEYGYTGSQITPEFDVEYQNLVSTNKKLDKNTDYTVAYGVNTSQTTGGTVTVTGSGNYTGTQTKSFTIGSKSNFKRASIDPIKYTGKPISISDLKDKTKVYSDSNSVIASASYKLEYVGGKNPTDVGAYQVKAIGVDNFEGKEVTATLNIVPADFVSTNALVKVSVGDGYSFKSSDPNAYTKPEIKVSFNGVVLKEGTDYTATFSERKNGATTGLWVDLTATKNLKGTIRKTFKIEKSNFSNLKLEATIEKSYVYDGKAKTPSANDIVLRDATNDVVLSSGDYKIKSYADNVKAGKAYVQIEAVNTNYTGTSNVAFTIEPRDISDKDVKLSTNELKTVSGATFDGREYTFAEKNAADKVGNCLSYNKAYLEAGTDYDIVFAKDGKEITRYSDAGKYTVVAKAKGNFKGEREIAYYEVKQAQIIDNFRLEPNEATYTGKPIEVDVIAISTYRSNDYTVSAPEMINKGTYDIVISGKGNYTGSIKKQFKINGVKMTDANTKVTFSGVSENGQVMVDVRTEGRRLTRGVDYTYKAVSINGADPEAWDVTIYPTGNYEGGVTQKVEFGLIVLEKEDIEVLADFSYTGQEQQLTKDQIRVTKGGKVLTENTDYTVSNPKPATKAGEFTSLSINGINAYTGVATAEAEIKAISLTTGTAKVLKNAVYTGDPVGPEVEVSVNGVILTKDVDYVVEVKDDAIKVGKGYTATIKGIGNYGGTIEVDYDILKPTLDNATIIEEKLPYTGKPQVPTSIKVMLGDKIVAPDQYDVTFENENSTEVGTYNLTITGKGNYEGTTTGTYQIVGVTLKDAKVEVEPVVYTGAKADPKVTVKIGDTTLVEDTDYIVDAGNAVNVKKDNSLTIVGVGNYSGEIKATFEIKPATITTSNVKVTIPAVTYNGKAQTPKNPIIIVGARELKAADYTLAIAKGANNTNAGKVKVTITGKGNYTGTVTGAWFTINRKSISKGKVSGIKDKTSYTGKAIAQGVIVTLDGKKLTKSNGCLNITYKNNKNIGPASLTITGKGNYTGTLSGRTFRIFPKKAAIAKVKAGSKRLTVQAKKQSGGVKYQIQYRVKGSKAGYTRVETKNPKKVIKALKKGKTYTVKVRAYKKVSGKIYYGAFSKAKNVKVK